MARSASSNAASAIAFFMRSSSRLVLSHTWGVEECAPHLPVAQIALLFEDPNRGEDSGIRERSVIRECLHQFRYGGLAARP
jgi:hypothetical protein